jgi:tetratricopeptide (TPR) repeat protein
MITRRSMIPVLFLLVAAAGAEAQMVGTPQPEKVSNRVLQLASEGKIVEAQKALEDALAQCRQPAAPPNCAFLLTFTSAYLAQQKGAAGADEARKLYTTILGSDPTNGPALNNLALIEDSTGNTEKAEQLWGSAIASDPERAGHYALLLGDHYLRLKNLSRALEAYDTAERSLPSASAPRGRVLSLYRSIEGTEGLEPLDARAREWQSVDPGSARAAYELLMARWSSTPATVAKADDVLVRWGALLALNDWLEPSSLLLLPESWKSPAIQELRAYVREPLTPVQWNWWRSQPDRFGATFAFARAMGRFELRTDAEGGPKKALQCYQRALHSMTPGTVGDSPEVSSGYLLVSQELASLYFDHPELDPSGRQFSEMLEILYAGKLRAIDRGDRRTSQAYHTTLAYIYVARKTWVAKPGAPRYMSAAYQLEAVLSDADTRERSEGYFQPLPEIKNLLVKALLESSDRAKASELSVAAALAYLDADALTESRGALDQARSLGANPADIAQVREIWQARSAPGKAYQTPLTPAKLPALFHITSAIGQAFLARQRFKICADAVAELKEETVRLRSALEAYRLVTEERTHLVGAADLLRWQAVESALLASTNGRPLRPRVIDLRGAKPLEGHGQLLSITLAGSDHPVAISVQQDTPNAVAVLRTVGVENAAKVRPYIRLEMDKVFVVPAEGDAKPAIDRLLKEPTLRTLVRGDTAMSTGVLPKLFLRLRT